MKRNVIILLLLGFFLTMGASALAADVKFSGEFIAGGMYLDKTTLKDGTASDGPSTAFYFQRLRVKTDIVVTPGLSLVTRFDAMERAWGAARSTPGTTLDTASSGTRAENENIAFDWAYINYASPIGIFRVGLMDDNVFGTVFADGSTPKGKIAWIYIQGPWFVTAQIVKMGENNYTATSPTVTASDVDNDKYCAAVKYSWKGGQVGLLGGVGRDATYRPTSHYKSLFYTVIPYAIVQLGPVKLQAEADYFWGKWKDYETATSDVKMSALAAWVDATVDFNKFYAGASVAYISGDDPGTTDKWEGNSILANGGRDWNPCLILFNYDRTYWVGNLAGYDTAANGSPMTNAWFFQGRAGVRPSSDLDIMASVSYATADEKPWATAGDPTTVYLEKDYGIEVDVVATYKITNNLSYMVGAGYLFTGDYFKGTQVNVDVSDNYLLINKLTLTF
jgi:hypothetical protein